MAISLDLVTIYPCEFCRQSNVLAVVGLNILLWIVLDFIFSNFLYLVMAIL